MKTKPTIAIIGAGKLGTVLATLALRAEYQVYIAGSGATDKIALSVKILTPGAIATTAVEAIEHADIVILAIPLSKYRQLPVSNLQHKLVIDAMNYWWEVDGTNEDFTHPSISSSEVIQEFLTGAHIVKALSHMGYHHLLDEAKASGLPGRKAIAIAGDRSADIEVVSEFVNELGFDPVPIGPLATGKILEPGHELFGANIDKKTLQKIVNS